MIEVPITKEMLTVAKQKAKEIGKLNNSIRKGLGNLAGVLGELCFIQHYPNALLNNTYDYDVLLNNSKIEIKTKVRTVKPKLFYECSVAKFNTKQKADYYYFVSLYVVDGEYVSGFLLGGLPKDEYFLQAKELKQGELDSSNNYIVKADCWNLPIKNLRVL